MLELVAFLGQGVLTTVVITASAFVLGGVLAAPLVAMRMAKRPWVRLPALILVEVTRAVPPLVWLFIIYYGIGSGAIKFDSMQAAIIGLGLVSAAHLTEIYRAGLLGLPIGQWEAVTALGVPRLPGLRTVIVPQAIVTIIPPAATFAIGLLKESAIASVIGAVEITFLAAQQTQIDLHGLTNFGVAALLYIALSVPIAIVARTAGGRLTRRLVRA